MNDRNLREGLLHELSGGTYIHAVVKEYKECKKISAVARVTKQISSALLLRGDKNPIYETGMMMMIEKRQQVHRNSMFSQFEQNLSE